MTETASIYKGENAGPWRVAIPLADGSLPTLPGAYTCRIKVSGTAIDRAVTDIGPDDDGVANKRFVAGLTPTEANTLTANVPDGTHYLLAIEVANVAAGLRKELHIILTVGQKVFDNAVTVETPKHLDWLKEQRTQLMEAQMNAIGGVAQQVSNGRYGNEVRYQIMTYDQISEALFRVNKEITAISGGRRRGHTQVVWGH